MNAPKRKQAHPVLTSIPSPDAVARVLAAYDSALVAFKDINATLRATPPKSPEYAALEAAAEVAFERFSEGCDDLRETRDGYRHTYPVGRCKSCGRYGFGCSH